MVRGRGVGASGGSQVTASDATSAAVGQQQLAVALGGVVHRAFEQDACVLHAASATSVLVSVREARRADLDAVAGLRQRPAGVAAEHQHVAVRAAS